MNKISEYWINDGLKIILNLSSKELYPLDISMSYLMEREYFDKLVGDAKMIGSLF